VQPFNQLIKRVGHSVPRFLINREQVGTELGGKKDQDCFRFDECDNQRDVQYLVCVVFAILKLEDVCRSLDRCILNRATVTVL